MNRRPQIRIAGPDDVELVICPAPNRYVMRVFPPSPINPVVDCHLWSIHNGSLRPLPSVELEILSTESFDDRKSAFREPSILPFRWPVLRDIGAGAWTDQSVLWRVDGDHLRLWNSDDALPWPKGDQSPIRRWRLTMRVTGLSKEWPIKLDLRWTLASQTLELTEDPTPNLNDDPDRQLPASAMASLPEGSRRDGVAETRALGAGLEQRVVPQPLDTLNEELVAEASEGFGKTAPRGARIGRSEFSTDHKSQFRELLAGGIELHASNQHTDKLPFGPWSIVCDKGDTETRARLKSQFRAAARKAAITAGAPRRAHVLNWWVSKLAGSHNLPFIQGLIQRSIDYCAELEANAAELAPVVGAEDMTAGLSRDRYPCERPVAYWLYDEPHRVLPDAFKEFEFWRLHIWKGFEDSIAELVLRPRRPRRWMGEDGLPHCEPKEETRRRVRRQVESRTELLDSWIVGLSYDLAVLQANHTVDLGLPLNEAMQAFNEASTTLQESVRQAWQNSGRLWGLSWRKQTARGIDLATPFRVVGTDLRHLLTSIALEAAELREPQRAAARGRKPNLDRRQAIREAVPKQGNLTSVPGGPALRGAGAMTRPMRPKRRLSKEQFSSYRTGLDNLADQIRQKVQKHPSYSVDSGLRRQLRALFREIAEAGIETAPSKVAQDPGDVLLQIHTVRPSVEARINSTPRRGSLAADHGAEEARGARSEPSDTRPAPIRKGKRGRPEKIPEERKRRALLVQGGKARAQILYDTKYPTSQQVKNVPSILKHYQRKLQTG